MKFNGAVIEIEQINWAEFEARLCVQNVPYEHHALKCARCGHVQSPVSMAKYMNPDAALQAAYYVCEGGVTGKRSSDAEVPGCDCCIAGNAVAEHKLEILEGDIRIPVFEPASAEEAHTLMQKNLALLRRCRVCGCDDFNACPEGCYWVESDLCSACAERGEQHE